MVVDDADDGGLNRLFHALSDPTRRDVLRRCAHGDLSVSRLAAEYPMSFAAVQKHVTVLERAGLVSKQRRGREQLVRTEPDALARARRALDELEALWRGRVERMSALLAQESPTPRPPARESRHTEEQDPGKGPDP
ncbi:metalloregulator ArsR/SmtB family transcription factor [Streptomyces bobili]|uniref:ArsR/SmtB family transcription factor n=1 Tax=Streptomyces bobili TaxID=67280 RepID=UPI0033B20D6E